MKTDELRRCARNVLLGDNTEQPADIAGALNTAALMIDYQRAFIDHMRAGIQTYLAGEYEGPFRHRPGQCRHGVVWHSACEECIDAHFYAVLDGIGDEP